MYAKPNVGLTPDQARVLNEIVDQTGHSGEFLTTDGVDVSWVPNATSVAWGDITGTLTDQTDLVDYIGSALDAYLPLSGGSMVGSISLGNFGLQNVSGIFGSGGNPHIDVSQGSMYDLNGFLSIGWSSRTLSSSGGSNQFNWETMNLRAFGLGSASWILTNMEQFLFTVGSYPIEGSGNQGAKLELNNNSLSFGVQYGSSGGRERQYGIFYGPTFSSYLGSAIQEVSLSITAGSSSSLTLQGKNWYNYNPTDPIYTTLHGYSTTIIAAGGSYLGYEAALVLVDNNSHITTLTTNTSISIQANQYMNLQATTGNMFFSAGIGGSIGSGNSYIQLGGVGSAVGVIDIVADRHVRIRGGGSGDSISLYSRFGNLLQSAFDDGMRMYAPNTAGSVAVADFGNLNLRRPGGNLALTWGSSGLYNNNNTQLLDWNSDIIIWASNGPLAANFGSRVLQGYNGSVTLNWGSRTMWDSSNLVTMSWGNRALIDSSNSTTLDWGNKKLSSNVGDVMSWNDTVSILRHIIVQQVATGPSIIARSGAGTSPTVSLTRACDVVMTVSVLTGTLPAANTNVVGIGFGVNYPGTPTVLISPANAAAQAAGVGVDNSTVSNVGFSLSVGAVALTGATTYIWNVIVIG